MAKINIADVQALIELAILNNKDGLIRAMNSSGYPVASNISDADLFHETAKVGDKKGIKALTKVLLKVSIDKTKLTEAQAKYLAIKFKDIDPNAKWNWNNIGQSIGDFFSGTTVINQNPNIATQTSESALSPIWIIITAILGIGAIVYVNKKEVKGATAISWVIGIIIVAVAVFGIFAKKTTITSSGGGGSQQIHNGALGWLQGILDGFNLSVIGK